MGKYFEEDRINIILRQLQNNKGITLANMAERLDISTKTLKSDIKSLNDILKDTAFIEVENGIYSLYIVKNDEFTKKKNELNRQNVNLDSPKKRMAYIFKTLISSQKAISIDDLAFDMNTGRTTIVGDIKNLNKALETFNISIQGKPNTGIKLSGSEFDIRDFLLKNIYDLIFFENYESMALDSIMDYIVKEYDFEEITLLQFKKIIVVILERVKLGYTITDIDSKYYIIEENIMFPLVNVIADELEVLFQITLSKQERLFMSIPVIGMRTPTNIETLSKLAITDDIINVIDNISIRVKEELNLSLSPKKLHEEFFYHIFFMVNRLRLGYVLKNPVIQEMKEKYQLAHKMAIVAGNVISEEYNIEVPEDEIGYITAYFGAYMLENKTNNFNYKIALVCSTGRGTARLILSHLKLIFDKETIFDMYASHQVDNEILEEYDIIFTTIKLNIDIKVPIIEINDIFDEQEIRTKIKKTIELHKVKLHNNEVGGDSVIGSILKEDNFFILDNSKNYTENLIFMIDNLTDLGYLDTHFKERIIEREKKSIMVFHKQIAFPHTINKESEKLIIAIGVSREGIVYDEFDKSLIKLVFLLGLPENESYDDAIMVRIYDEIISIAQNKNFIDELSSSVNFNDVVKNFIKLGIGNNL